MIGDLTKQAIKDGIEENLDKWMDSIAKAYLRAGDGLTVALPVTLKPKNGKVEVTVGISFTESKIKDENTRTVDEKQLGLFSDEPKRYPAGG